MSTSYQSGIGWYVAYCAPQQQNRAKSGIEGLGHEVYIPMERYRRSVRGKMTTLERPLLGPYLLFALDPHKEEGWVPKINDIDGIEYILETTGEPSRVPGAWITAMQKAERYGEFDRTPESPQPFAINERVRIGEGPYSGFHARIEKFIAKLKSTTASKRAKVALEFFGQSITVELPMAHLERA